MTYPQIVPARDWTFNLLPGVLTQLSIEARGIIHVGAHWGEEVPVYLQCGFDSIVLIEPDPKSCEKITQQEWFNEKRVTLHRTACSSVAGEADFHRAKDSMFSGLDRRGRHFIVGKLRVQTTPLSTIQRNHPANVLVVDTQGTELDVLQSADLSTVDLIIVETQTWGRHLYGAYEPDLMQFAEQHNWHSVIKWDREPGWTDTLLTPKGQV